MLARNGILESVLTNSWGSFRRRLFGIAPEETTFARRGFPPGTERARRRLEAIGRTFVDGYHAALLDDAPERLARRLAAVDPERRGFAFEGAAMGLSLRDYLTPWRRDRWRRFLAGPGSAHAYMVHVGVGWTLARLRRSVLPALRRYDPLLRWLVVDGYGFHEGYFHGRRSVAAQAVPGQLTGYARRAFDQGLGRSLWFVTGAAVARLVAALEAFPPARRADLWSGVGLACAYAGGVDHTVLETLPRVAGPYIPCLAQGAAFAAKARQRAGNPARHTDEACAALCGIPAAAAADLTDAALRDLPADGADPAYEIWRRRIQAQFTHLRR